MSKKLSRTRKLSGPEEVNAYRSQVRSRRHPSWGRTPRLLCSECGSKKYLYYKTGKFECPVCYKEGSNE